VYASSIARPDQRDRFVDGSFDLKRWAEGDVTGPMLEPMHPTRRQELDAQRHRREQEDEEFWTALRTVSRNF